MDANSKKKISNLLFSTNYNSNWLGVGLSTLLHTVVIGAVLWIDTSLIQSQYLRPHLQTKVSTAHQIDLYTERNQFEPNQTQNDGYVALANHYSEQTTAASKPNHSKDLIINTHETVPTNSPLNSSHPHADQSLQTIQKEWVKPQLEGDTTEKTPIKNGHTLAAQKKDNSFHLIHTTPAQIDAQFAQNNQPIYPELAKRLGFEGTVVLQVTVAPSGKAQAVHVAQSSGFELLDQSAIETLSNWKYQPAQIDGQTITQTLTTSWTYKLDNQ